MKKHDYKIQLKTASLNLIDCKPYAARITGVENNKFDLEFIRGAAIGQGLPCRRFRGRYPEYYFEDGYESSIKFKAEKSEKIFIQAGRAKCRDTEYFAVCNGLSRKIDRQFIIDYLESN